MKKKHKENIFSFRERKLIIILIDHHDLFWSSSSRLSYNTFDHCWMSLSRARVEHEIKNFKSEKKFKKFDLRKHDRFEIIWQKDLIILRSFDKKTWSFWSLHRSFDDTNATKQIQIRDETIKTNVKRLRMTITEQKIVYDDLSERSKKSSSTIWSLNDHHFLVFYRVQMMWNTTLDIPRMPSREGGTVYELNKQTNKQAKPIKGCAKLINALIASTLLALLRIIQKLKPTPF